MEALPETKRLILLKIFKKYVLPLFPEYFEKVVEKREKEDTWHEGSVTWDVFQPIAFKPNWKDHKNQEGRVMCTLPEPRGFWDAWLTLYHLENPKLFPHVSDVARLLVQHIERIKLQPSNYENFSIFHLNYLTRMAQGDPTLRLIFLNYPWETVFLLKTYPFVESACGNQDPMTFMETPECQKALEKIRSAVNELEAEFLKDEGNYQVNEEECLEHN